MGTPLSMASEILFVKPSISRAFITTILPCVPTPILTSEGDTPQATVVIENQTATVVSDPMHNISEFIIPILTAPLLGLSLRITLSKCDQIWVATYHNTMSYLILPVITFVITKVISGNIALSLGMVGALSIVRFRNPVKNSFELVTFFVLISIGIVATANFIYTIALTGFVIIIITLTELTEKLFDKKNKKIFTLSFREGESLTVLELVLKKEKKQLKNSRFLIQETHDYEDKKFIYKFASQNKTDIQNLQEELFNQIEKDDLMSLDYVYN